ncbi:hypothetical protein DEIPH_ctg033orf0209 [Deinococcus phoenicis]|uniref:Helix-turn-helix domain-containing protein n=1 Tax=Deinococcus phoenicis TaxID=1476583 RepID=A0A016QPF3_9DEIO|nr:helix-turn-helix domain-containing protein [Deinococcus phoenicis]EYB67767.1 hypothetical protein DEIPH_ctg033orf0209 [Deinococcus phoenicis]
MTENAERHTRYLTAENVAAALHVHPDTVYRLIREGRIRAVNIGSEAKPSWRIHPAELLTWGEK